MDGNYGLLMGVVAILGVVFGFIQKSKRSDTAQFEKDLMRLQSRVDSLYDQVEKLQTENIALKVENTILKEKVKRLEDEKTSS